MGPPFRFTTLGRTTRSDDSGGQTGGSCNFSHCGSEIHRGKFRMKALVKSRREKGLWLEEVACPEPGIYAPRSAHGIISHSNHLTALLAIPPREASSLFTASCPEFSTKPP